MTDHLIPFRRADRYEQLSDEALVAECARGTNTALDELFQRHGDRVHRIVARLRHVDRRDLEDVVQATFIEVQRSAGSFDGRASAGSWIVGIALNVVRHHIRGEARRRSAMSAVAETLPANDRGNPDELAAHRQMLERLQAGFDELPPDLRTVFALCDLEGMRGVDVARTLKVPEGTVWRRLHSARVRLRARLDGRAER